MRTPSIRSLVAALAVGPVFVIAVVLVLLLAASTRQISERLGDSLVSDATSHVRGDVTAFLADAVRVSDLYDRRLRAGILPTRGLRDWERPQLDDLAVNPGVASISFGAADGETTWLLRRGDHLELGRVRADGSATETKIDASTGLVDAAPLRAYHYDPRERPWYKAALAAGSPVWTPVYFWFGPTGAATETGAGYVRVVRTPQGAVDGVLVIDVTLGGLSTFLASLPFSKTGSVFIADSQGILVAASHGEVNSASGERLSMRDSTNPAARAAASVLDGINPSLPSGTTSSLNVGSEPSRVRVTPLRPFPGIDWQIVTVIPESAFLSEARSLQRRAMMLSIFAIAGGLVLALLTARSLSRPFMTLAAHVRRIGAGDFRTPLELNAARELRDLSGEINRMAVSLEENIELRQSLAVAMQVQQDLLPAGPPRTPGVDIAGQSKYCDATGGDYYDFIEVSDLPGGRVMIAVGDVMGHGIAAALLMATARAALRAHAWRDGTLGELMDRVNTVLSRESRHGRFMTMVLAILDPVERTLRWASAGHDPPMVYHPSAHRFTELEGGDVPLGVLDDTRYEEYTLSHLEPGAVVFVGTDGIWEAANASGQVFGKDRLREILVRTGTRPSREIASAVEIALSDFCGECRPQDDVTLVVMRLLELTDPVSPRPPSAGSERHPGNAVTR